MAQPITITIPHRLGRIEARARIGEGFARMQSQFAGQSFANVQQAWAGDQLNFSAQALGQAFSGRIEVRESDVRVELDLPAFLAAMADKIAGRVRAEGVKLLDKK
ncbi:MAG: polyhydroxyalkanoic acid system protein [Alphaproteobacteria bacterium]|nr:polyhydroxyalkanoic acid system protein [Alphaproteobacteria bacterium]